MTATQARIDAIERIRREHIPDPDGDPAAPHCVTCSDASYPIWPCAAAWLLEQHDALAARADLLAALDEVYQWQRETFPLRTPASIAAHLLEEAGELAREPFDAEEMADVVMLLSGLVRETGTNLAAAVRAKHAKNLTRDWSAPPNKHGYVKARAAMADARGEG